MLLVLGPYEVTRRNYVSFQVNRAVLNIKVYWDLMGYILVLCYRRFGASKRTYVNYPKHRGSKLFRNVGKSMRSHAAHVQKCTKYKITERSNRYGNLAVKRQQVVCQFISCRSVSCVYQQVIVTAEWTRKFKCAKTAMLCVLKTKSEVFPF